MWELVRDWNKAQQEWTNSNLKTLNPDEVEKEHKRMRVGAMRLLHQFEAAKMQKVAKLVEGVKNEIESFK